MQICSYSAPLFSFHRSIPLLPKTSSYAHVLYGNISVPKKLNICTLYLSSVLRKSVTGVSDQNLHTPGCISKKNARGLKKKACSDNKDTDQLRGYSRLIGALNVKKQLGFLIKANII